MSSSRARLHDRVHLSRRDRGPRAPSSCRRRRARRRRRGLPVPSRSSSLLRRGSPPLTSAPLRGRDRGTKINALITLRHHFLFAFTLFSPTRQSPTRHPRPAASMRSPSPPPPPPPPPPAEDKHYPGVNSLKRIKVSPPRPGQLYPQLVNETSSEDETRPGTAMSEESVATIASEAPSLGAAIKRVAR